MGVNVLPVPDDRRRDFHEVLGLVFGFEPTDADHERFDLYFPWERSRGAFDGESLVGTLGAFSLDMTVPGGTMACGGTTVVAVLPTHRRRGILRMMIDSHLAEVREKEEPIAGLWASDSAIYGRFGYGSAARATDIEIEREHAGFHRLVPEPAPVRLIDKEEAGRILPAFYDEFRLSYPGMYARSEAWWQHRRLHDDRHNRNGFTPFRFAVTESGGTVTGYVQYRYKAEWTDGHGAGTIRVVELFAADASALAGLWRYLLDHDLTAKVVAPHRAVDDPVFDLLAGRRRAKGTIEDSLWIRIMDVKRALEGRRYSASAATVLALHDPIDGSLTRWQLDLSPEGASVTPTSAEPEVTMDLEDLGGGLLGWSRFRELGRAGRLEGDSQLLARLDAAFTWSPSPWCPEVF
jgi:predicted acetyltransferase